MSALDIKALETNFGGWRTERAPDMSVSDAFERYTAELVLAEADLSDEDVTSGLVGGGDDGGIDGFYFFINRRLMTEDTPTPDPVESARLWLIQAKNHNGFSEAAVQKFKVFIDDLFAFNKPSSSFPYYKVRVRELIDLFREKYSDIIGQPHEFTVNFVYATKSDQSPNPHVLIRVETLKSAVVQFISSAKINFDSWGAARLTAAFRTPPNRTLVLPIVSHLMASDGSVVCLARLDKFAEFLTDDNGNIRQYLLDPNVRDYQGDKNSVNREIRTSLASGDVNEFWWLNNGITILADECNIAVGNVKIVSPELVNGLQTSYEVFNYFSTSKSIDGRNILVRVILPPDEQTRRRIVKATNSQSPVDPLSLHATEDIHFDIEELLKLYQVYYDRRKGEYRRLRKPISKIVGMKVLAQTVIACALRRPNDARARPMSVLGTEEGYDSVFDIKVSRDLYLFCILLDRQVTAYLSGRNEIDSDVRNDVQFYMDMWLTSKLTGKLEPSKAEIAAAVSTVKVPLGLDMLQACYQAVIEIYNTLGGDDKAAKGTEMRPKVIAVIKESLNAGEA